MTWKQKFIADIKWVMLRVLATVVATAILWEARIVWSIDKRLTRIETTLQMHLQLQAAAIDFYTIPSAY